MKILNKHVWSECKQNPILYAIYRTLRSPYDPDVDPLHNADWCEQQSLLEMGDLNAARSLMKLNMREWCDL
jgi:hypothetical protein